MELEARIHRVAQRTLPRHANTGYPPLVTVFMRHAPVLVDDSGKPRAPLEIDPRLPEAARRLGEWADLIVIPSNTPHFFLDELIEAAGCPIVDMIDLVLAELRARNADRVGLIGLGVPKIYVERLERHGMTPVTADESARAALDDAIIELMEGGRDERPARAALEQVRAAGAPVTVLGCTEIPLLLGDAAEADDLIDPAALLAEAAVRHAASD